MVNMRFTNDAQRRAVFANMFSSRSKLGFMVKNSFSEKAADLKEGLNGFICPKCGDVVPEDSVTMHSCDDSGVNSIDESSKTSNNSTVIEEYIIDDDEDFVEYEDDEIFG